MTGLRSYVGFLALGTAIVDASCTPMPGWHVSHAVASPFGDGKEYHSCADGSICQEGYACTKDGCEWCGSDDGVATRCTEANDGDQPGRHP